MKYTSSEAAKLLKKLNQERESLLLVEAQSKEFLAASTEDPESLRPDYDYGQAQQELEALEASIRKLKHAINVFNITTVVPGFDMTIDQMLVYIPQLSAQRDKLLDMKDALPKTRVATFGSSPIIDYTYTNYDIQAVKADYEKAAETLAKAQTALDLLNNTETLEVDL